MVGPGVGVGVDPGLVLGLGQKNTHLIF